MDGRRTDPAVAIVSADQLAAARSYRLENLTLRFVAFVSEAAPAERATPSPVLCHPTPTNISRGPPSPDPRHLDTLSSQRFEIYP